MPNPLNVILMVEEEEEDPLAADVKSFFHK